MRTTNMFLALTMVAACGGTSGPVLTENDAGQGGSTGSGSSGHSSLASSGGGAGAGGLTTPGGSSGSPPGGSGGTALAGAGAAGTTSMGGAGAAGGSQTRPPDAGVDAPVAGSSGSAGSGGKISSGGTTTLGGETATGGAAGGTTRISSLDAGANLSIPVGEVSKYQSCVSDVDCHIAFTNCSCAAVITQVVELIDTIICGQNNCPIGSHAACKTGKCTVVTAADAGVGGQTGTGGSGGTGGATSVGGSSGTSTTCGRTGQSCGADQFCDLASKCGTIADPEGSCVAIGTECMAGYMPVCGCDGKTYPNSCSRIRAGVLKASDGACPTDGGALPVCPFDCKTGSSGMGWYMGDVLVCTADCTGCTASCDNMGSKSEGCYATCSGGTINGCRYASLISYATCGK
jgi:hypothetical protein